MSALRRTAVGPCKVEDAITPEALLEKGPEALLSPSVAVAHLGRIRLTEEQENRVRHGNFIQTETAPIAGEDSTATIDPVEHQDNAGYLQSTPAAAFVRLEAADGQLAAIAKAVDCDGGSFRYQPFLVLLSGA